MSELREVIAIVLGWLFGLLSSPIVSRIMRSYKRDDIKKVLRSEMQNLAARMAGSYFAVDMYISPGSKEEFEQMRSILNKYDDGYYDSLKNTVNNISYKEYTDAIKAKDETRQYLALKTFTLPFTQSILMDLSLFEAKFQKDILWVCDRVSIINEEISHSMETASRTFDTATMNANAAIIHNNIESSYGKIRSQLEDITLKLDELLKENWQ